MDSNGEQNTAKLAKLEAFITNYDLPLADIWAQDIHCHQLKLPPIQMTAES